jgi:hypothetical protein
MRSFSSSVLEVSDKISHALKPVAFDGRVSEAELEAWIVGNPELVGEPLLVLGQQLAEFAEDHDRLDVLGIDEAGEIVIVELKVAENFRVTDLQALAYAGAYASRDTADLAETLRATLERQANTPALNKLGDTPVGSPAHDSDGVTKLPEHPQHSTVEEAKQRIVEFLGIEDFNEWQPSQHVRIKLVAPKFPRRVLKTVKWLGEVYNMPIEAVTARLFDQGHGRYSLTFERVLPLPDEGDFDLTVRKREERQRTENAARRPALLPVLAKEGLLSDGQKLWLAKTVLPPSHRDKYDPNSAVFQVEVRIEDNSPPKLAWRESENDDYKLYTPSAVPYHAWKAATGLEGDLFYSPVAPNFLLGPDGQTLEEFAAAKGVWVAPDS